MPSLTDSVFVVLALYFVVVYSRTFFVFLQVQPIFLIDQTFFLLFQLMALGLLLTRRNAVDASSKITDYVYALAALGSPMLFRPVFGIRSSILGELLEFVGAVLVIGAFLSLNRSFGIGPENRGIKTTGIYGIVRHPMYTGYLLTETGFVLRNFSFLNVIVLATAVFFLGLRIRAEERFLVKEPAYQAYAQRTPWKLVPFIF